MTDQATMQALLAAATAGTEPAINEVPARLAEHLGHGADRMEILNEPVSQFQHVNLQAALDAYVAQPGRRHELFGVRGGDSSGFLGSTMPPHVGDLLGAGSSPSPARFGPVEYINREAGYDDTRPCVSKGLVLIEDEEGPLLLWIRMVGALNAAPELSLDVVSPDIERSRRFLGELGRLMRELNVYRGQVVTIAPSGDGVVFVERVAADRDAVILPPGVLETLEEQTIGIGEMRDRLQAAGRHLKRGLLLYGPPGTGKTHTIRYLTSRLSDYTVFYLTGSTMAALNSVGAVLPMVAPAVLVLDDVDLIAEDRDRGGLSPRRFLFDLLDVMDGLRDDLDVAFILTTNRVETIEGAISTRPGRVDQAVEIPLPDRAALARLLDLYGQGLDLRLSDRDAVLDRIQGVTASFVREMLRRASLVAARETDGAMAALTVTDAHVNAALDRLLDPASPLTSALLGRQAPIAERPAPLEGAGAQWCPLGD